LHNEETSFALNYILNVITQSFETQAA